MFDFLAFHLVPRALLGLILSAEPEVNSGQHLVWPQTPTHGKQSINNFLTDNHAKNHTVKLCSLG